jgi:hypothetical protein
MKIRFALVLTGAALLMWAAPARAHHSFSAQYDATKPVEKKGTVSKVEWTNPHARFYIDVKNEKGEVVESWNFELASPNVLVRNGWKRTTLRIGEPVTVTGYLARSGPPSGPQMAIASAVIDSGGRSLFASAPEDLAR